MTLFKVVMLLLICYIVILIWKEVRPLSHQEKYLSCLKLGSDTRAAACINLINKNK